MRPFRHKRKTVSDKVSAPCDDRLEVCVKTAGQRVPGAARRDAVSNNSRVRTRVDFYGGNFVDAWGQQHNNKTLLGGRARARECGRRGGGGRQNNNSKSLIFLRNPSDRPVCTLSRQHNLTS
jgi:hypothetical protein